MKVHMQCGSGVALCGVDVRANTNLTTVIRDVTCRECNNALKLEQAEAEKIRKEAEAVEQAKRIQMMTKALAFIKVMRADENWRWRTALRVILGENATIAGKAAYEFVSNVALYIGRVNESLDGITRQVADVRRELDGIGVYNIYTSEAERTACRANDILVNMGLLVATMSSPNMLILGEILVNAGWTEPEEKKEA